MGTTSTALLLLLSGVLIAAGVSIVWRDVHKRRRDTFVVERDAQPHAGHDPDLEITTVLRPGAGALPADAGTRVIPLPDGTSSADAAAQWAALQPVLAEAVQQVNAVLEGAGVSLGAPGEPSWSMNRGYGAYRRVLIGGESLAWLRLELGAGGKLNAGVKAHKDDLAVINANASVAAQGLSTARASDLLSECLKPAAGFAVRAANGGNTEHWASEMAWKAVDAVVASALLAANGALAQAGAHFTMVSLPTWAADVRRHRMTVAVEVFDQEVARMLVERVGEEIEVAVGVPDARLADLGRRQRLPIKGLTTHALAELIASSAWPAIAHFREAQPSV
jgi:hypothetical protein